MTRLFKGWAGVAARGYITGWCLYLNDSETPLEVQFLLEGEVLGAATADEYRQHLSDRGIGTGSHGFRINLNKKYPVEILKRGVVRLRDNPDQTIALSEKVIGSDQPAAAQPAPKAQSVRAAPFSAGSALLAHFSDAQTAIKLIDKDRWKRLNTCATVLAESKDFHEILLSMGRGALYEKNLPVAYQFFNMLIALSEDESEATFYLGATYLQDGHVRQAISIFWDLYNNGWNPARSGVELAKAISRLINSTGHAQDPALSADFLMLLKELLKMESEVRLPPNLAQVAAQIGDLDLAYRIVNASILQHPDRPEALVIKTRILIEMRKIDEAMDLSDKILERWPDNLTAANNKRIYGYLRGSINPIPDPAFMQVVSPDEPDSPIRHGDYSRFKTCNTVGELFRQDVGKEDILVFGLDAVGNYDEWQKLVSRHPQAGCIIDESGIRLWRAKAIRDLGLSDLIDLEKPLGPQLSTYEWVYTPRSATFGRGAVVLLSRYGIAKFGGAEHTMESLAYNYKSFGLEPHILGVERAAIESHSKPEGIVSAAIENDPNVMRQYFIKNRATVVHAISGMGYQVAHALEMTNITFVYGVYFWRDVLGRGGGETFFEEDHTPIPREEFGYVMAQAQTIFANSEYTRDMIEAAHGIRCPVIPSIPGERI